MSGEFPKIGKFCLLWRVENYLVSQHGAAANSALVGQPLKSEPVGREDINPLIDDYPAASQCRALLFLALSHVTMSWMTDVYRGLFWASRRSARV
jgi:hypothetical protein